MPLYIVRWPNLSASLIQADDEDHLQELFDEIGDPGAAIWEEYRRQRYAGTSTIMGATGLTVLPKHLGSAVLQGLHEARKDGRNVDDEIMAMAAQQRDDLAWREAQQTRLEVERLRARQERDDTDE